MNLIRLLFLLPAVLACLCLLPSARAQPWFDPDKTPHIAATDLRPGMRGEVWTVFRGTEPEPFEVEFVGLLENRLGPGKHMILCLLTDPRVQASGAVAGMSGSPLYFGGKLAGALSYSIQNFETVRHAGFTPIEDILEVSSFPARGSQAAPAGTSALRPVFNVHGLRPATIEAFRPELERLGIELQVGAGGSLAITEVQVLPAPAARRPTFIPGDAIAVALAFGDITLAGTGTVSFTRGEEVYAFGHSMVGAGTVAFPMARAEIVTIAASLLRSFKVSNTREVVGTITQDRLSAIFGKVGMEPPTAELHITLMEPAGPRTLLTRLAIDKDFTPMLCAMALFDALDGRNAADREAGHRISWSVGFHDLPSISRSEILAGPGSERAAATDIMSVLGGLMDHPLGRAVPERIDIRIEPVDTNPASRLTRFFIPSGPRRAGDTLRGELGWQTFQGGWRTQSFSMALDAALLPGSYELVALPGRELDDMELARAGAASRARSLLELIEAQRSTRRPDGLHIALVERLPVVREAAGTITSAPDSFRRISTLEDPDRVETRTLARVLQEQHILPDLVFSNGLRIPITIEE